MKILIIGKSRLLNEMLTESLICRGFEAKATDNTYQFFAECCETSIFFFHLDNELLLNLIELNSAIFQIKKERNLKFIIACSTKNLAVDYLQMDFGYDAMLLTQSGLNDVCFAINEVSREMKYLVPELKEMVLSKKTSTETFSHPSLLIKNLTKREKEVLAQIANSKTTTTIARKLYISISTVNNHKANIMEKLQISGRNTLITAAIALKPWLETAA